MAKASKTVRNKKGMKSTMGIPAAAAIITTSPQCT